MTTRKTKSVTNPDTKTAAGVSTPSATTTARPKARKPAVVQRTPMIETTASTAPAPADPPSGSTDTGAAPTTASTTPTTASGTTASPSPAPAAVTPSTSTTEPIPSLSVVIGAPPDVTVPSVPDGFVAINSADLKGYSPMQSEIAVVSDAVLELQGFANYALVFGMTAPDQGLLVKLLQIAAEWTAMLTASTDWLTYVKSGSGIAWKDALVQMEALKAPFQLAVNRTPTLMSQYPSLNRLLGAQTVVAKRAASSRAKNAKADAATKAAATTSAATATPAVTASATPAAPTATGPTVTVQA